jgi:hypothetical protein
MAVPKAQVLGDLAAEVTEARGVMASATVLIDGIPARLEKAVAKALELGATEEELQPIVDEVEGLKTDRLALAAAVAANPT